jgi:hypothetical protein
MVALMFNKANITRTSLLTIIGERITTIDEEDIPTNPDNWSDSLLLKLVASQLQRPTAGHLHKDLGWLSIGDRFRCGGGEWQVTDIGTRTLTAVKIDEKVRNDPSWLNGPTYAIAETTFDADDFPVIAKAA